MAPKTNTERSIEHHRRQQEQELLDPSLAVEWKERGRLQKAKSRAKLVAMSSQSTPKKPSALVAAAAASSFMSPLSQELFFSNQAFMLSHVGSNQKERAKELNFLDRLQSCNERVLGMTNMSGPPPDKMAPKTSTERTIEQRRRQQEQELLNPSLAVERKEEARIQKAKSRAKLVAMSSQSTPKKPSALVAAAVASSFMSPVSQELLFLNQAIMLSHIGSNQKEHAGVAALQRQELNFLDRLQSCNERVLGITDMSGPPPSPHPPLLEEIDEVLSEEEKEVSEDSKEKIAPPPGNVGVVVAARKVGVAGALSVGVAAPPAMKAQWRPPARANSPPKHSPEEVRHNLSPPKPNPFKDWKGFGNGTPLVTTGGGGLGIQSFSADMQQSAAAGMNSGFMHGVQHPAFQAPSAAAAPGGIFMQAAAFGVQQQQQQQQPTFGSPVVARRIEMTQTIRSSTKKRRQESYDVGSAKKGCYN
jgi:hypothetical protein